jgi:N-acetylmuramoyl-L-alanine amidase
MRRENDELRKSVLSLSNQLSSLTPRNAGSITVPLPQGGSTNGTAVQPPRIPTPAAKGTEPSPRLAQRAPEPRKASTPKSYTLKAGDTLDKIAKAQGITLQQLQAANPGLNTRKLKPGVEIRVP